MRDICDDCGMDFTGLMTIIPDDDWKAISPHGNSRGMLCPWCMGKRLAALGRYVRAEIRFEVLGLLASNSEASAQAECIGIQQQINATRMRNN